MEKNIIFEDIIMIEDIEDMSSEELDYEEEDREEEDRAEEAEMNTEEEEEYIRYMEDYNKRHKRMTHNRIRYNIDEVINNSYKRYNTTNESYFTFLLCMKNKAQGLVAKPLIREIGTVLFTESPTSSKYYEDILLIMDEMKRTKFYDILKFVDNKEWQKIRYVNKMVMNYKEVNNIVDSDSNYEDSDSENNEDY